MNTPNANTGLRIYVTGEDNQVAEVKCTRFTCMSRLSCPKHPESRELVACPYGLEGL